MTDLSGKPVPDPALVQPQDIFLCSRQMCHLDKEAQALKAILYVLRRIRDEKDVAERLGFCTENFQLLTEAAAALTDEPVEKIRVHFGNLGGEASPSVATSTAAKL
jgi:hypothetical protein